MKNSPIKKQNDLELKKAKNLLSLSDKLLYANSILVNSELSYRLYIKDNTIKLWEIESGGVIHTFVGHSGEVTSLSITANEKYIVSGSWDGTVKMWDIESGKEIVEFMGISDNEWISSTSDGYYNCSDSASQYITFFDDSKGMPKTIGRDHSIYKERKKEKLLDGKLL